MAAAAGEQLSFDSALAATLQDIFFEKRTKNGTEVLSSKRNMYSEF